MQHTVCTTGIPGRGPIMGGMGGGIIGIPPIGMVGIGCCDIIL